MRRIVYVFILICATPFYGMAQQNPYAKEGYKLVWSDEFNKDGVPDSSVWSFEHGFVRNHEYQWYQKENAYCKNGLLIIEGKREKIKNPRFEADSHNWRRNREFANYSSACMLTRGKKEFLYGRFVVRARIDTSMGLWPAIWFLGRGRGWPASGEIDLMESYPTKGIHYILANVAHLNDNGHGAKWHSKKIPLTHFLKEDPQWPLKFHTWRMDWDKNSIKLYLDNELLNETDLKNTLNPDGFQPFHHPEYILLNLAIGGQNGGDPSYTKFPTKYEIDYVRVYQKE